MFGFLFTAAALFLLLANPTWSETVNLIAYTGTDQNIYTMRPDGTQRQNLTQAQPVQWTRRAGLSSFPSRYLYDWPSWSPDGRYLLAHGTQISESGTTQGIYLLSLKPPHEVKPLYKSATDQPIYTSWAPDAQRAAVLLGRGNTIALTLLALEEGKKPKTLGYGIPFYFDWSQKGDSLLIHTGGSVPLSPSAEVALLRLENSEKRLLSSTPADFRAPSWSPDGKWLAFAAWNNGQRSLFLALATGEKPFPVYPIEGNAAFSWSPRSTEIALAFSPSPADLLLQGLLILRVPSGASLSLTQDPVGAFFWSPTGEEILYASPNLQEGTWSWYVVRADGSQKRKITEFFPSRTLLRLFAHFDQYALSHRLWSPDGRRFVYSGFAVLEPSQRPSLSPSPQIFVAEAEGGTTLQPLAEGSLAFWSPR